MNRQSTDTAEFYREKSFPGKNLMALGVGIWAVHWLLTGHILTMDAFSAEMNRVASMPLLPAAVFYLTGFWLAVKGKGYHPAWFLLAFTGFVGLAVILFMPDRKSNLENLSAEASAP